MFIDCRFAARSVETKTIVTVIQHMPRSAIVVLHCSHDTVSLDCMWEGYSTLHVWLLILLAPWFFFRFSFLLLGIWLAIIMWRSFHLIFPFNPFISSSNSALSYFHFQSFLFLGRRIWELSSAVLAKCDSSLQSGDNGDTLPETLEIS